MSNLISSSKKNRKVLQDSYLCLIIPALQFAVETRRPGLVSLLLTAGASIPPGLLHSAVRMSGYLTGQEISLLLIRHGADVTARDREGRSPLSWAVCVNNKEIVEELLRAGGDPHSVSRAVEDTASSEVRDLVQRSRSHVAKLQSLAGRLIRRTLVNNRQSTESFEGRLSQLPLPTKLIRSIN